jgi:HEAT repeat protein
MLSSVGNTYDSSLAGEVEPYLRAESLHVRDAAADALGSLSSPEAPAVLTERLPREPEGKVRSSIVESLRRLEARDPETAALVNELAPGEPDAQARFFMVRYLVESLDVFPGSRQTLERMIAKDGSERIRVYLARALLGPAGR